MIDTMISTIRKAVAPTEIGHGGLGPLDEAWLLDGEISRHRRGTPGDERQHLTGEAAHQREKAGHEHDGKKDEIEERQRHRQS
jgi:hypothetical protein